MNHYRKDCPEAEAIVRSIASAEVARNQALPAKLLRLFFHDCFVRGCDASVLLDTVAGGVPAEKDAIPNLSLGGLDFIDKIKAALEAKCQEKLRPKCLILSHLGGGDAPDDGLRLRAVFPVMVHLQT